MKLLIATTLWALSFVATASGLLQHESRDKTLSVDQAFRLMPIERDGRHLRIQWEVAPGHYLYRERLGFEIVQPTGSVLSVASLPKGEAYHDEHLGNVQIYRNMTLTASFKLSKSAPHPTQIKVRYQGCADIGICYPPQTRILSVPN